MMLQHADQSIDRGYTQFDPYQKPLSPSALSGQNPMCVPDEECNP